MQIALAQEATRVETQTLLGDTRWHAPAVQQETTFGVRRGGTSQPSADEKACHYRCGERGHIRQISVDSRHSSVTTVGIKRGHIIKACS